MPFLKFRKYNFKPLLVLFCLVFSGVLTLQAQRYTVVLDAGHGGKDPGASDGGIIEKKIALKVALKTGKILEKNSLIKVVYTRKTDHFVELHKRAKIANTQEAVLFVSLHCDSFKPRPAAYGASTYVLGLKGNATNMQIAKRENSVILLEEDYQSNYDYDPNAPETVIGLSVLQEENLDASLAFASMVQSNFVDIKRKDRSVKQQNFLVLRETVMPSVLIELGFLTNNNEAKFLNSSVGQSRMAKAVANAIENYVNQIHVNTVKDKPKVVTVEKIDTKIADTSSKKISKPKKVKNEVKPVSTDKVVSTTKKTNDKIVKSNPKTKPVSKTHTITSKKYKPSVIEFRVQVAASKQYITEVPANFKGLKDVYSEVIGEYYKYFYGSSSSFDRIKNYLLDAKDAGVKGAFVVAFENGQKISLKEAIKKQ